MRHMTTDIILNDKVEIVEVDSSTSALTSIHDYIHMTTDIILNDKGRCTSKPRKMKNTHLKNTFYKAIFST